MKTIIGNWKMHLNTSESSLLVSRIVDHTKPTDSVEVVLCPSAQAIYPVKKELDSLKATSKFRLGIQNVYFVDEGAYTGEISAEQVKDLVDYAIVGHSERRIHFGERDEEIAKKVSACLRASITPVLCVGERLDDRHEGHSEQVVRDQLNVDLSEITAAEAGKTLIAYEPIWAIGTGEFADPEEVKKMADVIKETCEDLFDKTGKDVSVLYGGSVDGDNAKPYLDLDNIDGLLVGGSSVNYEQFSKIVELAH